MHLLGIGLLALAIAGLDGLEAEVRPQLDQSQAYLDAGENAAARRLLEELLEQNELLRDGGHPLACEAWHQLAYAQYGENAYEAAASSLRQALEVAEAFPGDTLPPSQLFYELGYLTCFDQGDAAAGAASLKAAVDALEREGGDALLRASWMSDLAEAWRLQSGYDEAERWLRQALRLTETAGGNSLVHAIVLNNLGALYWDQNRLTEAERLYRDALALSHQLLDQAVEADVPALARRVATAQLNLGVILHHQQRWDAARRELEKALALVEQSFEPGDAQRLFATSSLAKVCQEQGDEDRADALWRSAIEQSSAGDGEPARLRAEILHDRALALLDRGESEAALPMVDEAIELWSASLGADHPMVGRLLTTAARAEVLRGDPTAAVKRCDQALARLQRHSFWPEATADALTTRGLARRRLGQDEAAIADVSRALQLVETLRTERGADDMARLAFVRRFAEAAQSLVVWQVEAGHPEQAVNTVERIRARLLQDELRADRVDLYAGIDPGVLRPLLERQQNARAKIAELQRTLRTRGERPQTVDETAKALDAAMKQLAEIEDEIRLHSPAWRRSLEKGPQEDLVAVVQRQLLATDEAILYYDLGTTPSYAFLIPDAPQPVQAFALGREAAGGPLMRDDSSLARAMITDAMRGVGGIHVVPEDGEPLEEDLQLAGQLHDVFRWLVPSSLWRRLTSLRRVIVIPDAELHALPFEALVVQPPRGGDVRYWLDAGPTVAYGHSLGVLSELARRPAAEGPLTVLSVSDPDFGGALPALPGSALESNAVVEAFGADRVQLLQGADATEKAVRRRIGDARYVHLATHGLVDRSGDGRLSALALTSANAAADLDDDGLLQLFEIYDLRLDCDLAVLSACETQTGRRLEGEGMFALSRGFHVAGARQTIASLWSVNDDATAALMSELFEGIAEDERVARTPDVAELLRAAKQTIRADARWIHPAYWAPFVLSGWEQSSTKENSP